jgi:hypothetical protein
VIKRKQQVMIDVHSVQRIKATKPLSKLDTATGESAIQIDVAWDIENYTDATARQYLIDTYHWAIHGVVFPSVKSVIKSLPAFLKP